MSRWPAVDVADLLISEAGSTLSAEAFTCQPALVGQIGGWRPFPVEIPRQPDGPAGGRLLRRLRH